MAAIIPTSHAIFRMASARSSRTLRLRLGAGAPALRARDPRIFGDGGLPLLFHRHFNFLSPASLFLFLYVLSMFCLDDGGSMPRPILLSPTSLGLWSGGGDSFLRRHTYFGLVYRYFFPGVRTLLYYTVLYFTGGRYRIAFVPSMLLDVLYLLFRHGIPSGSATDLGCSCAPISASG